MKPKPKKPLPERRGGPSMHRQPVMNAVVSELVRMSVCGESRWAKK